MGRLEMDLKGRQIHLAVEGSTGGTTIGLHFAADTIASGQRVLWASTEMPNPARFSQLFEHLSLVESSRFHAMNFGGRFDRAIDALLEAATSLPYRVSAWLSLMIGVRHQDVFPKTALNRYHASHRKHHRMFAFS